eukprot:TRINITY_DN23515_c0_g1_i1.p1 TRINITY_DN23515_c0_g1~~TRINITY_DN23515_c0_g1_i1.p1  ORF type:complete len:372 (+),score=53.92 TRINITY_DN23515_c0_g1_i1:73-1188(+)
MDIDFNKRVIEQVMRYSHIATDLKGPVPPRGDEEELRVMQQRVLDQRAKLEVQREMLMCSPYEGSRSPSVGVETYLSNCSPGSAGGYGFGVRIDEMLNHVNTLELRLNNHQYEGRRRRTGDLQAELRKIEREIEELTPTTKPDTEFERVKVKFAERLESRGTALHEISAKISERGARLRDMIKMNGGPIGGVDSTWVEDKLKVWDDEEARRCEGLRREAESLRGEIERVRGDRERSEARFLQFFEEIVKKLASQLKEERRLRIQSHEKLHYTAQTIVPPITLRRYPTATPAPTTLRLPPSTLFTHLYNPHPSEPATPTPHPLAALDFNTLHSERKRTPRKPSPRGKQTPRKQLQLAPSEKPEKPRQKPRWR